MQNFGKIKNAFNGLLAEGMVSKNNANKVLFKKYIQAIKESEILKTQFLVYNNIENKMESDPTSANVFLSENVKLLQKYSISDIIEENKKLVSLSNEVEGKLDEAYELSSLHDSITNIIFTKINPNNINEVTKSMSEVVSFIQSNKEREKTEAIDLPSSMVSTIMVDKYNDTYSTLDESDRKILKSLIESTDEQKKEVYSTTLRECIDLINDKLTTSDLEAKDKLLRVKDKLLNDKQEISEDFPKHISKLVELRDGLKK